MKSDDDDDTPKVTAKLHCTGRHELLHLARFQEQRRGCHEAGAATQLTCGTRKE